MVVVVTIKLPLFSFFATLNLYDYDFSIELHRGMNSHSTCYCMYGFSCLLIFYQSSSDKFLGQAANVLIICYCLVLMLSEKLLGCLSLWILGWINASNIYCRSTGLLQIRESHYIRQSFIWGWLFCCIFLHILSGSCHFPRKLFIVLSDSWWNITQNKSCYHCFDRLW